ncbi:hypothetical protein MJO29_010723 [Puccinia striiformis f. sp. tritici]|nr:hypothetical protein MJO29_010723 [Puccinia striiformis f. sp. tritici]
MLTVTGLRRNFVMPWRGKTKQAKASWKMRTSWPAKLVGTPMILRTRTSNNFTPAGSGTPTVAPSPLAQSASMAALAAQRPDPLSQRQVSYAKRITHRLFPSCEEVTLQSVAEPEMNRTRMANEDRMVNANIELANALPRPGPHCP